MLLLLLRSAIVHHGSYAFVSFDWSKTIKLLCHYNLETRFQKSIYDTSRVCVNAIKRGSRIRLPLTIKHNHYYFTFSLTLFRCIYAPQVD